ncbi:MAG TPA: DUF2520 domain-containing protein [Patescibacteria group bacterium]|nr:DUF2520 domain-containing protein [Patescibacteria group bacterium]
MATALAGPTLGIPDTVSFVHLSGALGLEALQALRVRHAVGSFHPLQSFPGTRPPAAFEGITVATDASAPALLRRLSRLARDLGAHPVRVVDRDRVLYHAAAVFASNYVDVVVHEAVVLLQASGWSEREATRGLLPLVDGSIENIRRRGTVAALTGPIRRGDADTVRRHLDALHKLARGSSARPEAAVEAVYRMLGSIALDVAKRAGLDPAAARRIQRALTGKAAATRRRSR